MRTLRTVKGSRWTVAGATVSVLFAACGGNDPAASSAADPTGLIAAATAGDIDKVRRLLDANTPVDSLGPDGGTALSAAVVEDHANVAGLLLDAGASVNVQAANQDTPWLLAGELGRGEILQLMLLHEPDFSIRNRFGGNALIPACERGHVDAVRVLLRSEIDLDHVNNLGWTCLLELVVLGDGGTEHQAVARLVLAAGADPNLGDREGVTATQHARLRGQREIEAIFAEFGGR